MARRQRTGRQATYATRSRYEAAWASCGAGGRGCVLRPVGSVGGARARSMVSNVVGRCAWQHRPGRGGPGRVLGGCRRVWYDDLQQPRWWWLAFGNGHRQRQLRMGRGMRSQQRWRPVFVRALPTRDLPGSRKILQFDRVARESTRVLVHRQPALRGPLDANSRVPHSRGTCSFLRPARGTSSVYPFLDILRLGEPVHPDRSRRSLRKRRVHPAGIPRSMGAAVWIPSVQRGARTTRSNLRWRTRPTPTATIRWLTR